MRGLFRPAPLVAFPARHRDSGGLCAYRWSSTRRLHFERAFSPQHERTAHEVLSGDRFPQQVGILLGDFEEGRCGSGRFSSSLFPVLKCSKRNTQHLGKFPLGKPCCLANPGDWRERDGNSLSLSGLNFSNSVQNFLPDVPALFHLFEFFFRFGHFQTPPSVAWRYVEEDSRLWIWSTESARQSLPEKFGENKSPGPRLAFPFPSGSTGFSEGPQIRESRLPSLDSTQGRASSPHILFRTGNRNRGGKTGKIQQS